MRILPTSKKKLRKAGSARGGRQGQKTTDVSALRDAERYDVTAHDKTDTVATVVGAVYLIDDVYYLGYQGLGNPFFDANGNASYHGLSHLLIQ